MRQTFTFFTWTQQVQQQSFVPCGFLTTVFSGEARDDFEKKEDTGDLS